MSTETARSASARVRIAEAVIREDILQRFPGLFGTKTINGREVKVEQAIAAFARELDPEIAAALTARSRGLRCRSARNMPGRSGTIRLRIP